MPTIAQCFSALVASGNGQRCNDLRKDMHTALIQIDEPTGQHKSVLFKFGREDHPETHKEIRQIVARIVNPRIADVDAFYFGNDIGSKKNAAAK